MGYQTLVPKVLKPGTQVQIFLKKNLILLFWERQAGLQNEVWMKGTYHGECKEYYDVEIKGEPLFIDKAKCILVRSTSWADNPQRVSKIRRHSDKKTKKENKLQKVDCSCKYKH